MSNKQVFFNNDKLKNNLIEDISFKELTLADFVKLHQMYDNLTEESKQFFNLYWLGLKSRSLKWYFAQVPLFLSTIKFVRSLIKIVYPRIIFLSSVAIDKDQIVCFGFLIIRKGSTKKGFSAELGVATDENYRGRGLATQMIDELIKYGRVEGLKEIYLTVRTDNKKAFRIYEKLGFKKTALLRDEVEWKNKKYDMFKMILPL